MWKHSSVLLGSPQKEDTCLEQEKNKLHATYSSTKKYDEFEINLTRVITNKYEIKLNYDSYMILQHLNNRIKLASGLYCLIFITRWVCHYLCVTGAKVCWRPNNTDHNIWSESQPPFASSCYANGTNHFLGCKNTAFKINVKCWWPDENFLTRTLLPCSSGIAPISVLTPFPIVTLDLN